MPRESPGLRVEREFENTYQLLKLLVMPRRIEGLGVRQEIVNSHPIGQLPILGDVGDLRQLIGAKLPRFPAKHFGVSGCGMEHVQQDLDRGGLAGSIGSE